MMIRGTILRTWKNLHAKCTVRKISKKIKSARAEIFMEKCKAKTDEDKISCDSSMMPPCETRLWVEICNRNYQLLWFERDLSPSSPDITYNCEENDDKYCMLLLLFFDCVFSCIFYMISA